MIKFNVKSLILAFCVLGGMVTAGVASAIPEHYRIEGTLSSGIDLGSGHFLSMIGRQFNLDMNIDSDLLADPLTFTACLGVDQVGSRCFGDNGQSQDPNHMFRFDVSRSIYSEGGLIISKLVADVFDPHAYGSFNLDLKLLQDGSIFDSAFSFALGSGFGGGQGTVDSVTRIALPTPSAAFLMIPALLLLFGRSFASKLKPALVNKKKARFEMYPALSG